MKIKLFSDLHFEFYDIKKEKYPDLGEGNILILAGDIFSVKSKLLRKFTNSFLKSCRQNYDVVLYVMGNHEHYGYLYQETANRIRDILPENCFLLENDVYETENWIFPGCTLWTDFNKNDPIDKVVVQMGMNDYSVIRYDNHKLRTEDTYSIHVSSMNWLNKVVSETDKNVFVITHHAPSFVSTQEYRGSELNPGYASDLSEFILNNPRIQYWVHGHTHVSNDYEIGQCRILSNPYGYHKMEINSNFNPEFELTIQ